MLENNIEYADDTVKLDYINSIAEIYRKLGETDILNSIKRQITPNEGIR